MHSRNVLPAVLLVLLAVPLWAASPSLVFTTPDGDPIVALTVDSRNNIVARTDAGQLWLVPPNKKSASLATGLDRGGFSCWTQAVLPDGAVMLNDKAGEGEAIVLLDQKGNRTNLQAVDSSTSLLSAAAVSRTAIYVGYWGSTGDISVSTNPNHLGGADNLYGRIATLDASSKLSDLWEGGLPMALAANGQGEVYAAIWGEKGAFDPENKSYSICDPRHIFWIGLSEQVQIRRILPLEKADLISDQLVAVSSMAWGKNALYAYGMLKDGKRGIFRVKAGSPPVRVNIPADMDKGITGLAISGSSLYFANVDGKVYKVGI